MPALAGDTVQAGQYQVVAWDLDTTGRKLIDEICQIGGHYSQPGSSDQADNTFSQYVMPHRNPNPGARRSFGIKVVSIGRYRMLKDLNSGKILKTKSEVSALQDFISWLGRAKGDKQGVILICHEPERKVSWQHCQRGGCDHPSQWLLLHRCWSPSCCKLCINTTSCQHLAKWCLGSATAPRPSPSWGTSLGSPHSHSGSIYRALVTLCILQL